MDREDHVMINAMAHAETGEIRYRVSGAGVSPSLCLTKELAEENVYWRLSLREAFPTIEEAKADADSEEP